ADEPLTSFDPRQCRDLDGDTCDDCAANPTSSGTPNGFPGWPPYTPSTANDGLDTDGDGMCNVGDDDDDNDGVDDVDEPGTALEPRACGDADADSCDDCARNPHFAGDTNLPWDTYMPNTANDGVDTDGDGLCNAGDPDDDNDN